MEEPNLGEGFSASVREGRGGGDSDISFLIVCNKKWKKNKIWGKQDVIGAYFSFSTKTWKVLASTFRCCLHTEIGGVKK